MGPSEIPADCSGMARGLDKILDRHRGDLVAFVPVDGQVMPHVGQKMGAEVGNPDPWQDPDAASRASESPAALATG